MSVLPKPDKSVIPKPKDYFDGILMEMDGELKGIRILKYRIENHIRGMEPLLYTSEHKNEYRNKHREEKLVKMSKITESINQIISDLRECESQMIEYYVLLEKED